MQHEMKGRTEDVLSGDAEAAASILKSNSIQADKMPPQTTFKIIDFGHGQMKGRCGTLISYASND